MKTLAWGLSVVFTAIYFVAYLLPTTTGAAIGYTAYGNMMTHATNALENKELDHEAMEAELNKVLLIGTALGKNTLLHQ